MGEMKFDIYVLTKLGEDLKLIGAEFENADANSYEISDSVGHSGLAQAVRRFASEWDDTRRKMIEAVLSLAEGAAALAQTLVELDQGARDSLLGQGDTAPAAGEPTPMLV